VPSPRQRLLRRVQLRHSGQSGSKLPHSTWRSAKCRGVLMARRARRVFMVSFRGPVLGRGISLRVNASRTVTPKRGPSSQKALRRDDGGL